MPTQIPYPPWYRIPGLPNARVKPRQSIEHSEFINRDKNNNSRQLPKQSTITLFFQQWRKINSKDIDKKLKQLIQYDSITKQNEWIKEMNYRFSNNKQEETLFKQTYKKIFSRLYDIGKDKYEEVMKTKLKPKKRGRKKKEIETDDTSDDETDLEDESPQLDNTHNTNNKQTNMRQISTRSSNSLSYSIQNASTETHFNISNDGKQLAIYPKGSFAMNLQHIEKCNIIFEDGSIKQLLTFNHFLQQNSDQMSDNHFEIMNQFKKQKK
eukprot:100069_1